MAKRTELLQVRMSEDEWSALDQKAKDANISMSKLVRTSVTQLTIRHRKDQRDRTVVLNRLNANLNMIAKWCNTHKDNMEAVEVISHLIAIERQFRTEDNSLL